MTTIKTNFRKEDNETMTINEVLALSEIVKIRKNLIRKLGETKEEAGGDVKASVICDYCRKIKLFHNVREIRLFFRRNKFICRDCFNF